MKTIPPVGTRLYEFLLCASPGYQIKEMKIIGLIPVEAIRRHGEPVFYNLEVLHDGKHKAIIHFHSVEGILMKFLPWEEAKEKFKKAIVESHEYMEKRIQANKDVLQALQYTDEKKEG